MAIASSMPERTPLSLSYPIQSIASRIGRGAGAAILESGRGFGRAGRWSFYGAAMPCWLFEATGDRWAAFEVGWSWRRPIAEPVDQGEGDPLEALTRWIHRLGLDVAGASDDPDRPPFTCGLIGYLGYDLAPRIERLPRKATADTGMPDCRFALYEHGVTVDHETGAVDLWSHRFPALGRTDRTDLDEALRFLEGGRRERVARSRLGPLTGDFDREGYCRAVRAALNYIAAGDAFQVNLSQRFTSRGKPNPLDLYLRLRRRSPSPYAAFLNWEDVAVVGASPELFYQTQGRRIVTRPIKGTRPRGHSPAEDALMIEQLRSSAKDRAELTMIVDLERNDLGRVCEYGSVKVIDPLAVETFAQVHHLVATVEGRLRPEVGPIDVVRAMFPGGSITGAPKIRAMEIIDELEPNRRGLYTGAIGYFGLGGNSAFNIAIRTMIVEGDRVSYQVGGGIVADSDPESEYEETLHKGRSLREVIEASGDAG